MIESVDFQNFRALRSTSLPLGRFTLIIGPNASGKSTSLRALVGEWEGEADASLGSDPHVGVSLAYKFSSPPVDDTITLRWGSYLALESRDRQNLRQAEHLLANNRSFSLSADAIIKPVLLNPGLALGSDGANLAGVLDALRDEHPERFEALNKELSSWLPEFDRVLFNTPSSGQRGFLLRTRLGQHPIPAANLSQGTVLALAILTLAYLPAAPPLVAIEDPDRGLHPRLFRHVQDAMYRLAYPEKFDEHRAPVQVVATTHSPYLLDLYRDNPGEVVIAQKVADGATFERLVDRPDLQSILEGTALGDAWYSGILGGVPLEP